MIVDLRYNCLVNRVKDKYPYDNSCLIIEPFFTSKKTSTKYYLGNASSLKTWIGINVVQQQKIGLTRRFQLLNCYKQMKLPRRLR